MGGGSPPYIHYCIIHVNIFYFEDIYDGAAEESIMRL